VVVEDPRHFADDARHHDELLYTALLPLTQFRAVLYADIEVARLAYSNPSVRDVLIRKNQGRESGALAAAPTQPGDRSRSSFPARRAGTSSADGGTGVVARHPHIRRGRGLRDQQGATAGCCTSARSGVFPRSYEVVFPDIEGRLTEVPRSVVDSFAALLHEVLGLLGPLPLDYEIHDGSGSAAARTSLRPLLPLFEHRRHLEPALRPRHDIAPNASLKIGSNV
jgi:hypothetical protein